MEKTAEDVIKEMSDQHIIDLNLTWFLVLAEEIVKLKHELTNLKGTSHGGH